MFVSFANHHGRIIEFQGANEYENVLITVMSNRQEILAIRLSESNVDQLLTLLTEWKEAKEAQRNLEF